jgi:exopolysaccharide biosynthesis predicted pyruvyltransferase EpsI
MEALRRTILDCLAETVRPGPYALLDYPNYLNPGDAAIWLGARRALEMLTGNPPAYSATLRGFSAKKCRTSIGSGTVYFLGGGNFGDLYARHQRRRLDVLGALTENPVVQLPMSCALAATPDGALIAETRTLYQHHPRLRIFVRDSKGLVTLRDHFGLEGTLCPDTCHMLDVPAQPARQPIVKLMRRDPETVREGARSIFDWRDAPGQRLTNRIGKLLLTLTPARMRLAVQDRIASRKVTLALATLARGHVVETDRLHAALLAAALGRRVILHDNWTGKVLAYRQTWADRLPDLFDEAPGPIPQPEAFDR